MILHMGFSGLILEENSSHVIDAIKSKEPTFSALGPLIVEIHHLLHQFSESDIYHVGRRGNEVAHSLTNMLTKSMIQLNCSILV